MNKPLQLTMRELVLLALLFVVGTAVLMYYLLLGPQLGRNDELRSELALNETELEKRRLWQAEDDVTKAKISALEAEQAAVQAKFDYISSEQDIIDYLVDLSKATSSTIESLEIAPERLLVNVSTGSYDAIRLFLADLEASPNYVPSSATIGEGQNRYTLHLDVSLHLGKGARQPSESYPRKTPFGG